MMFASTRWPLRVCGILSVLWLGTIPVVGAPVRDGTKAPRSAAGSATHEEEVLHIGSRLELFVDHHLIDTLKGARLKLHEPWPGGVALKFDRPWEGAYCAYVTVLKDGDVYRMYYRGLPVVDDPRPHEVTCYAESRDGIAWHKPNLGLFEVNGTRENNVVLAKAGECCHNFSPFVDTRPGVPASQRYKAVAGMGSGLMAFVSGDAVHWNKLREEPVFTAGRFDSQNVAFWSASEGCYVCYFRTEKDRVRWIGRTTSPDFVNWSAPVLMSFGDAPPEHLYTNQTSPYFRAPHIYIATAARFMPGRKALTDDQYEATGVHPVYRADCSDTVLLSTRGGNRYDRTFLESFVRPGTDPANWTSRTNYPALGVVPTGSAEMSIYVQRHYGQVSHYLERLTLRTDGFVSVHAPYARSEMITKPLTFAGKELVLNFATSAAGGMRVEIQDADGEPIPGYALLDSVVLIGDEIERVVSWRKSGADVSKLAGRPIRLRFVMEDADLYSVRFR